MKSNTFSHMSIADERDGHMRPGYRKKRWAVTHSCNSPSIAFNGYPAPAARPYALTRTSRFSFSGAHILSGGTRSGHWQSESHPPPRLRSHHRAVRSGGAVSASSSNLTFRIVVLISIWYHNACQVVLFWYSVFRFLLTAGFVFLYGSDAITAPAKCRDFETVDVICEWE